MANVNYKSKLASLEKKLKAKAPAYFIGIGGVGMSGLAHLLLSLGFEVYGSDSGQSPRLDSLKADGAHLFSEHRAEQIPANSIVIYSSAIPQDNPERVQARQHEGGDWHRSQLLQVLLNGPMPGYPTTIGVTGTHGKTTITGMIGTILKQAKLDPTVIVGGKLPGTDRNVWISENEPSIAIAELDESDGTILAYQPTITVLSNLELDHLDHYQEGLQSLLNTFGQYFQQIGEKADASNGSFKPIVVLNSACPHSRELIQRIPESVQQYWLCGPDNKDCPPHASCVYKLEEIQLKELGRYEGRLVRNGVPIGRICPAVPGYHNLLNAAQSMIVADLMDVPFEQAREGLQHFTGMGRRFEVIGTLNQALLVDDYAHHPTEVTETLKAAQAYQHAWNEHQNQENGQLKAIFQPHRYSRLQGLWADFLESFDRADEVYVVDVYSAGEAHLPNADARSFVEALNERGISAHYLPSFEQAHTMLEIQASAGDLLITLGAGSVTNLLREHPKRKLVESSVSLSSV